MLDILGNVARASCLRVSMAKKGGDYYASETKESEILMKMLYRCSSLYLKHILWAFQERLTNGFQGDLFFLSERTITA